MENSEKMTKSHIAEVYQEYQKQQQTNKLLKTIAEKDQRIRELESEIRILTKLIREDGNKKVK